jgi:hypothetical protein
LFSFFILARVPSAFLTTQFELGLLNNEKDFIQVPRSSSSQYNPKKKLFNKISDDLKLQMKEKMYDLSTKCMVDTRFKGVQASSITTAIIYYTRKLFGVAPAWNDELTALTFHDPRTSKSTQKALNLLVEMLGKDYVVADGVSATIDDLVEEEAHSEVDSSDEEEEDREDDESEDTTSDLVQALQKALFIDENPNTPTPVKETKTVLTEVPLKMITPVVKNMHGGSVDLLSPTGIDAMN